MSIARVARSLGLLVVGTAIATGAALTAIRHRAADHALRAAADDRQRFCAAFAADVRVSQNRLDRIADGDVLPRIGAALTHEQADRVRRLFLYPPIVALCAPAFRLPDEAHYQACVRDHSELVCSRHAIGELHRALTVPTRSSRVERAASTAARDRR